jgi:hypothetical protein
MELSVIPLKHDCVESAARVATTTKAALTVTDRVYPTIFLSANFIDCTLHSIYKGKK